jgi:NNP family nitrate/nitrite transporter-like MFS transporter
MDEKKSPFRWVVLALLFLSLFFATIAMNSIPPLFTEIGKQIPLTKAQMGSVMGVLTLASLIFAPLGGGLSDKIGSRWAFGISIFIVGIGGALRGFMQSASGLIAAMFLVGVGIAPLGPNMPKALGMWFPRTELALAFGICMSGMGIGGAVAMGTAKSFISPACGGWRNAMMVLGGLVFIMGILWIVIFKERKSGESADRKQQNIIENFKKIFQVRDVWLLSIFYGLNMMGIMSLITLLPPSLEERGISQPGGFVAIMLGTSVFFNIVGGVLSDRVGKRKPFLFLCTIILGLCVFSFAFLTGTPLILSLIIAGAALGTIAPVLMVIPVELENVGHAFAATAVGIIFMVGNTGGFIGPIVAGKLMDISGNNWSGFLCMALALIIAAAVIAPLTETGGKKKPGGTSPASIH